jgi:hypothetical protein
MTPKARNAFIVSTSRPNQVKMTSVNQAKYRTAWKKLLDKATKHEQSLEHKRCVSDAQMLIEANTGQQAVRDKVLKGSDDHKTRNRKGVVVLFSVVRWLATQKLAFRRKKLLFVVMKATTFKALSRRPDHSCQIYIT